MRACCSGAERCNEVSCALFVILITIVAVPSVLTMPHIRSTDARIARHARALRCGYDTKFVEVDEAIAARGKAVLKSMELFRKDVVTAGVNSHRPIDAALLCATPSPKMSS